MAQVLYYDEKTPLKRVYYTGSDALLVGYALCYDRDNITATAKGAGPHLGSPDLAVDAALTAGYENYARHAYVEKPAAGNLKWFAGVVVDIPETGSGPGKGPGWIDILEPSAIERAALLYTDLSCTINATPLHLKAGSYLFGAPTSGGPKVGTALQTVNRSSDNGLVQATFSAPDVSQAESFNALSRAATALPTAGIWRNFPLDDMRKNPWLGSLLETDFTRGGFPAATWLGDTTGLLYAGLPAIGELIFFSSADNDEVSAQWPCPIDLIGGGEWAFEARVKATVTTTEFGGWFLGLAPAQIQLGDIIADNGASMTDNDYVGFLHLFPKTDEVDIEYKAVGQTLQIHDAEVKTMTTVTYFTVGMHYDGTDVQTYVDGVNLADPILGTGDLDAVTFPSTKILIPTMVLKGGDAADFLVTLDWMRFAQVPA